MTTVGVIGLGEIGSGVAKGLRRAGLPVVVCDVRAAASEPFARNARVAADPAEVGERADVTIVAVVDDAQVLEVTTGANGCLVSAIAGSALVVVSTVSLSTLDTVAAAALRRDVDVVDCGVSGGPSAAADGGLVSMVGGDRLVVERLRPVLGAFSTEVLHMGGRGCGLRAKLARNLVQYASWLAALEGQQLAEAGGVDLLKLSRAIKLSDQRIGGASTLMFRTTAAPFTADDDPGMVRAMRAGAALAAKDLGAALALADDLGVDLPLARMTAARCDDIFGLSEIGVHAEDARCFPGDFGEERMLIDGALVRAGNRRSFETVNPATEEVLGVAAEAESADLDRAISAARRTFDDGRWSGDLAWRLRCLRQLQEGLLRHSDELRAMTVAETGSPVFMTTNAQLDEPVSAIGWVCDMAEGYEWEADLGTARPLGVASARRVRREPVGVVGAITPWNVPHQINLAKVVPALAAGNTVVLKPAPDTPWCATVLGRIAAEETDLPAGALNIVTSSVPDFGAALVTDPRVDLVSFTGSTATGRRIMSDGAGTLTRLFLELGGKSAFVVLDDADLSSACGTAAFMVCTHAGQGCAITTRLLVPRGRFDEAVETTASVLGSIGVGDPTDPGTICGPLISARQRDRVESYIGIGRAEGASVVVGGGRPAARQRGFFVEPTLLVGVDNQSRVAREEIFGPVLVAIPHDGDDHAVELANDSPYGLSGAVWSAETERARAVANRIRTGTISINGGVWYSPDMPFGGYKQSGIGREMGVAGFEEYLETKAIAEAAS